MASKTLCLAAACGLSVPITAFAQCPPQWLPGHGFATSPINGNVKAFVQWDSDGAGPAAAMLVASASFPRPSQPPASIAGWNGTSWQILGQTPVMSPVALAVYNGELIAGGFGNGTGITAIARWNGQAWLPLGTGVNSGVRALWTHGDSLYAGGEFTLAGGVAVNKIARWDGEQWHDVGGGLTGGFFPMVFSFATYQNDLIVGGFFDIAGSIPASRIARWDGQLWHALGDGRAGSVDALGVFKGRLIAGGSLVASAIAQWDGESWGPLGLGVDQAVRTLTVYNSDLIAGGFFQTAGGVPASRVARWDGENWGPLTSGIVGVAFGAGQVDELEVFNGELVSGGFFDVAGGQPSINFARWTDTGSPWFTQSPASQTVQTGGVLTLVSVAASGYPGLEFSWRRNGVPIVNGPGGASAGGGTVSGAVGTASGGTSIALTLSGIQPGDAGLYDLLLTHQCANVASTGAVVSVTGQPCYANCDNTTSSPLLTGNDFVCFLTAFASGNAYANCDGSTSSPALTANDFTCFLTAFVAGCS